MLKQNLSHRWPYANMRRFMDGLMSDPKLDELNLSAPIMQQLREADADVFAPEFAHGPAICDAERCAEIQCIAYRRAITDRLILLAHPRGAFR
jgi:hypothetical protein